MSTRTPMPRGLALSPDVLERQGRALRRLARSLLGDAHAAEDVVQETWLACLRHPGRLPARFSGWLATVTRHTARKHVRGETRRREREERAAVRERRDAFQQLTLEREEALRAVTAALLELEEPFKGALIQRYFEQRTPAEIAALADVPLATVKSRLARGLERLRAKLGAEHGAEGRARALLVLAGARSLVPAAGVAAGTAGGLGAAGAVGTWMPLAGALGILAAAALVFASLAPQGTTDEPRPVSLARTAHTPGPEPASGASGSVTGVLPASEDAGAQDRREPVARPGPEPDVPAELLAPETRFSFRLAGRIRDGQDLPLSGARIFLGPKGERLNRAAETDDEGRFAVELTGRQPTLGVVFAAESGGTWSGLHELRLAAGREFTLDLALGESPLRIDVTASPDEDGDASEETREDEAGESPRSGPVVLQATGIAEQRATFLSLGYEPVRDWNDAPTNFLERAPELRSGSSGRSWFASPVDLGSCPRPRTDPRFLESVTLDAQYLRGRVPLVHFLASLDTRIQLPLLDHRELRTLLLNYDVVHAEPAPVRSIEGIVRDESGEPVAGAEVGWGAPGRRFEGSVETDELGVYRLEDLPCGEVWLRAGGGDHGLASARFALSDGDRLVWDPVLDRELEVRGRIGVGPDAGLGGCRIELWSFGGERIWSDTTSTDSAGAFALPNVPPGPLTLYVLAGDGAFPVRVVAPVFGGQDLGTIELTPGELAASTLTLRTLRADGERWEDSEVVVWQLDSGMGTFAPDADEEGLRTIAGLPAGSYRLELCSETGMQDLGSVRIAPPGPEAEPVDLGEVRPTPVGRLQLDVRGGEGVRSEVRHSLWRARQELFVHALDSEGIAPALWLLPPGDWVLCTSRPGRPSVETRFTVRADETTRLLVALEEDELALYAGSGEDLAWSLASQVDRAALLAGECGACHAQPR